MRRKACGPRGLNPAGRALRGADRVWRGSPPRGVVGRGRVWVGTRWFGSVALRVVPVGGRRGSSPRVAVVGGRRWAATRWVGSVPLRSAAPGRGLRGCAAPGVSPETAEVSEPNPALHLTPPSNLRSVAHCMMAVQVSFMFGHHRVQERACGGGGRVVRDGESRASGSAWCRSGLARLAAARCGGRGRWRVGTRRFGSVVLRVVPVGVWRGSSPRGAVVGGLRWAATRWCGSVVAPLARTGGWARADAWRGRERAEPGAAPDTARGFGTHRSLGGAVQVSCSFGNPKPLDRGCGGADGVVRVSEPRVSCSAWCRW
ncbi:hypothetical protein GobsT_11460 [Gemmata obscuriglobus]|nr:hypothetical protein GobsT_11460 [Gemmata obscuriglobus]VTS01510.1 unnamed protein product [Gemmata obscuriglobus UQM 2246]